MRPESIESLRAYIHERGGLLTIASPYCGGVLYRVIVAGYQAVYGDLNIDSTWDVRQRFNAYMKGVQHSWDRLRWSDYPEYFDCSGMPQMCTNYSEPDGESLMRHFGIVMPPIQPAHDVTKGVYQDYKASIIIDRGEGRVGVWASYGIIPRNHMPPGTRFSTMNARDDSLGTKKSFKAPWDRGQLCLVPMTEFFEPFYPTPDSKPIRYRIALKSGAPFCVAGLFRAWKTEDDETEFSFTQITVNADSHEVMGKFHKWGEEKRSLVIISPLDYDHWLTCRDPEIARTFLKLYHPSEMEARPAPKGYGEG